jgi:hypothetical protein
MLNRPFIVWVSQGLHCCPVHLLAIRHHPIIVLLLLPQLARMLKRPFISWVSQAVGLWHLLATRHHPNFCAVAAAAAAAVGAHAEASVHQLGQPAAVGF